MNIPTKFCFQLTQFFQRIRLKTENTIFDIFGPLVSFEKFQSTKKIIFFKNHPMNIPTEFAPVSLVDSEKKIKNRQHSSWHLWVSCLFKFMCFWSTRKKLLLRGPFNEHSYQVLFPTDPVFSKKKIENRKHHFWHIWASCFLCEIPIKTKTSSFLGTIPWTFLPSLFQLA